MISAARRALITDRRQLAAIDAIEAADPATEVGTIQAARIINALGVLIDTKALERLQATSPDTIAFRRIAQGGAQYSIGALRFFVSEQEKLSAQ